MLAGILDFVIHMLAYLLFGWIPERPKWAMWLVISVYVAIFGIGLWFAVTEFV